MPALIAAIYARKSTEQTGVADEAKSVARQVEHARAYAASKGWNVSEEHIYVDDAISGAEFAKRPGFARLMNALKPHPPFQFLVMMEESRLGRETIEAPYALKQLITADVRVFLYLEDRERRLDSPTDKIMLSLTAFADELEREKARQRTYDAMIRKARAGYVTGGRPFGYDNVRTNAGVRRQPNEAEAAIVRRIFELAVSGLGFTAIAKTLNADQAPCPRPQQGRPAGWAPSSVREILFRPLYRGEVVWNTTQKRNSWGIKRPHQRPESEWTRHGAPELALVSPDLWYAAQTQIARHREQYARVAAGRPLGSGTKYLLSGLLVCGCCQAGIEARTRAQGSRRVMFYGCSAFHRRGASVCGNRQTARGDLAEGAILESVRRGVLDPAVLVAAISDASNRLAQTPRRNAEVLEHELRQIGAELGRLTAAIATGGDDFSSVKDAMRDREVRRAALQAELEDFKHAARSPVDIMSIREELTERTRQWREALTENPGEGKHLLRQLIRGRITLSPGEDGYHFHGVGTVQPLVAGIIPHNLASLMPASWNQIALWLWHVDCLRSAA